MAVAARDSRTSDEPIGRRILRGVFGGAVSGLIFMLVTMWFADSVGDPSSGPLMMISTTIHIVFGALLSLAFFGSEVRASEPVIALNTPVTS